MSEKSETDTIETLFFYLFLKKMIGLFIEKTNDKKRRRNVRRMIKFFLLVFFIQFNNFIIGLKLKECDERMRERHFDLEKDIFLGERLVEDEFSVTGIIAVRFNATLYNLIQSYHFLTAKISRKKAIKACKNSGFDDFYYQLTTCFHNKSRANLNFLIYFSQLIITLF